MKKLLVAIAAMICVLALNANAQDAKKPELSPEQKAFRKEMVAKYDANKNGKLDKEEFAAFSKEDKEKWDKLFPKPQMHKHEHEHGEAGNTNAAPKAQ